MILYGYSISPYAAKIRAILQHKGLPFEERHVHPLRRGALGRLSGQRLVPVLDDSGHVVADSSRIARYLDQRYPERPVIPADAVLRARALLLEEWADEGLPRVVQPVRWLIPANADKTMARFRAAYPPGRLEDAAFFAVRTGLLRAVRSKYGALFERTSPAAALNRLAEGMDLLDAALAETGYLVGPTPTVADFAAWGLVHFLEELDGWETVKARRNVARWLKAMAPCRTERPASEAYDDEDAALLEASRHRRDAQSNKTRLPLV
jgi:glutathione S-transferase